MKASAYLTREELQRQLSAARGEASFHQDRTIFLESEVKKLEIQRHLLSKAIGAMALVYRETMWRIVVDAGLLVEQVREWGEGNGEG